MSWDIYGQPLRPGHCEIHPDVHEPYPCSMCFAENDRRIEQERRESEAYEQALSKAYEEHLRQQWHDYIYDLFTFA